MTRPCTLWRVIYHKTLYTVACDLSQGPVHCGGGSTRGRCSCETYTTAVVANIICCFMWISSNRYISGDVLCVYLVIVIFPVLGYVCI